MRRSIDPIVSTGWLASVVASVEGAPPAATSAPRSAPVIVDIRSADDYAAGHIPGAVSAPFGLVSAWAVSGELTLELPRAEDLFKAIGDCGIRADSPVIVVGTIEEPGEPMYPRADPVRVATTLIYAGVEDVAVLAGGYPKWVGEGLPTTAEMSAPTPILYKGAVDDGMFVSTEYVETSLGRAVVVDGRDADQYFGAAVDVFAGRGGHIPTARSLPLIWVWQPDGDYREKDVIARMAAGVVGDDKEQEVILYCGVGGYAGAWWFLLTQLLDYADVKIYDGAAEAWAKEGNPFVEYSWTR